jgi:hypothetical protein
MILIAQGSTQGEKVNKGSLQLPFLFPRDSFLFTGLQEQFNYKEKKREKMKIQALLMRFSEQNLER